MKTDVIKSALRTGEIDAGIVAGLSDMDEFDRVPLFYEPFHVYVSRESELFGREVIRTSDLSGEQLWLLDEGHHAGLGGLGGHQWALRPVGTFLSA